MEELSLFDFPQVEINKPIRLIELFGGIGSQAMALRDIGANFEHYRLVEFDKYAVASYNAIHGTAFETMDIRDVHADDLGITECDKYTYIMTYSFPCTDLSVAGKMKGMSKTDWENGNSTRSGLLWEVERILKECKKEELPQILLMENVPQVHAEQNMADFESWLAFLRSRGYHNHWQDLNAKDYGIPQNRDRCFCVSILSDEFIDFEFPKPIKLNTVMRDFLEDEVDEKYYINNEKSEKLIKQLVESGVLSDSDKTDRQTDRQTTRQQDNDSAAGGNIQPKIIEETRCVGGLAEEKKSNGGTQYYQQDRVYKGDIALALPANLPDGSYKYIVVPTLTASSSENINYVETVYRIRKLTPKECFRLMSFRDEDFEAASKVNSNSQLYKQSGNSICECVLKAIFSQMGIKGVPRWNDTH